VRVAALVRGILDISGASPRRYFFEVLQHFATAELEVDRLEYFATPEGRNDLYTYNQKEGEHTVVDNCQTVVDNCQAVVDNCQAVVDNCQAVHVCILLASSALVTCCLCKEVHF